MRPGDRDTVPTVEEAVRKGAHAADPDGTNEGVTALVLAFEGDERPATATEDLIGELRSSAAEVDPPAREPLVAVTAAAAAWVARNPRDAEDPARAIREGSRMFFGEPGPPSYVEEWLAARQLD